MNNISVLPENATTYQIENAFFSSICRGDVDGVNEMIKKLLKSDTRVRHNIKKLFKEKTINDTIVAVISLISIILAFFQVIFH